MLRARSPLRRDGGRLGGLLVLGLTAFVGALLAVTVAGRELSAPAAIVNMALLFLPYLYATAGIACFALWVAVPDRRLPGLMLGIVFVVGVYRWGPRWSQGSAPAGQPLTAMSWNVRRLWGGPADGGNATACVVAGVRAVDPDVVTFLEVSRGDVDLLERELELDCTHTPYLTGGAPKTGGLAACVRRGRWRLVSGSGQRFVDREDWSYVLSEIEREGQVFNLLAVHLYPYRVGERDLRRSLDELWDGRTERVLDLGDRQERVVAAQSDQSAALLDRVAKLHDPTIVAGDFNSTRDMALHVALRTHLQDVWERAGHGFGGTIQVFGSVPLRVDYIYASPAFAVQEAATPAFGCSDHEPVTTQLVLPAR